MPQCQAVDTPTVHPVNSGNVTQIDAGIIFDDESNYLCIPLDRLGIASATDVLLLRTSCECARATLVQFLNGPSEFADALRIDFVADPAPSKSFSPQAVKLAIDVNMQMRDGGSRNITIYSLHTLALNEG